MDDSPPDRRERRHNDVILATLNTRFNDFTERYERELLSSYKWREDTTERLKIHCEFVKRVSPVYQRMMWLFALITTSTIGIAVAAFFKHLYWK